MTISAQHLLKTGASNEQQRSEKHPTGRAPARKFQQCLRTEATDHRQKDKGLFSLLEEEEKDEKIELPANAQTPTLLSPLALSGGDCATAAIAQTLSPDLELLFEKMASAMILQTSSQETETTLFLDNPQSLFCGTQITIREFSSAPKAFNIEIISNPIAAASIEAHKAALLATFQQERFSFTVHRLHTYLHQNGDRPVLFRKETADHDQQQGGHKQ